MKKVLVLSVWILGYSIANSQVKNQLKVDLSSGFERNTFLAPSQLSDEEAELVHATYQTVRFTNSLRLRRNQHKFKLYASGMYTLYQTEENSNKYAFRLKPSYRVKYTNRKYIEVAPEFSRINRSGLENVNEVLVTLFSYSKYKVPVSFDFYLGDRVWLKTDVGFIHKSYGKLYGEKLSYNDPYVQAKLSKKFISGNKTRKLSYNTALHFRTYSTLSNIGDFAELDELGVDEEALSAGTLNWNFVFNNLRFKLSDSSKDQSIEFGLHHISRLDQNKRSSYHEFGPSVRFNKRFKKLILESKAKYTYRFYPQFSPNEESDNLTYTYLKADLTAFYALSDKTQVFAKGVLYQRTSNNQDMSSLSFREFSRPAVEVGLRITL